MEKKKLKYGLKSGFKTPEAYFESWNKRALQILASEEEDSTTALPEKTEIFSVPTDYFETTESQILQKTIFAKKEKKKVFPLFQKKGFYYAAASIAAFFILYTSMFQTTNTSEENNFTNIEISSMENYIEEGYIDFSASEITSFFEEEEFILEMDISEIENEEIVDYLDDYLENPDLIK